eukprot:CAMPEP_0194218952 /NCGR_PEP_ID=MMETSP0156-20130528/24887_1 /TAXON_ID=33649 /ORGANISM="Thalassionema nitzschioides, Strain L26-B" /LENGTH=158 /DNA_ID=CAMNT_0038948467 /DNA_START=161 /DNA_END=634 /DNA_ORIENTATION=+
MAVMTFDNNKDNHLPKTLKPRRGGLRRLLHASATSNRRISCSRQKTDAINSRLLLPSLQEEENILDRNKPSTRPSKRRHRRLDSGELMGLQFLTDDNSTTSSTFTYNGTATKAGEEEDDNWDELSADHELCIFAIDDTIDDSYAIESPTSVIIINDEW